MNSDGLTLCRSYVSAQTTHPFGEKPGATYTTVTLSRQAGARGRTIARMLSEELNGRQHRHTVPWTVFDCDLMDRVLADHDLPRELARFFPEARWSEVDSTINVLLRRHPDAWTVFEHTVDTISKLGHLGHAIIVGRGANYITQGFKNVLHLRLIGSRERRLEHLRTVRGWSEPVARVYLESEDRNRRAFVRQHFHADIDDPQYYSMVLNTDNLTNEQIVSVLTPLVTSMEGKLGRSGCNQ